MCLTHISARAPRGGGWSRVSVMLSACAANEMSTNPLYMQKWEHNIYLCNAYQPYKSVRQSMHEVHYHKASICAGDLRGTRLVLCKDALGHGSLYLQQYPSSQ